MLNINRRITPNFRYVFGIETGTDAGFSPTPDNGGQSIGLLLALTYPSIFGPPTFPDGEFSEIGGFFRFEADNPDNNATAVSQDFSPSDVDTTNNWVTLTDQSFGAFTTYTSARAVVGWFTTTGTLPAPLTTTDTYYRTDLGSNHARFYKAATSADYAVIPGAVPGEYIRPAQRYAQNVDWVDFTTQGSGTHTFHTWPLTNTVPNMVTGKNYTAVSNSTTDKQTFFEIAQDSDGNDYWLTEKFASDPSLGSYRGYGKTYPLGPTSERLNISSESALKRWCWQVAVLYPNSGDADFEYVQTKFRILSGSGVNTTTNTITPTTTQVFGTGDGVKFLVWPGSSLPSGVDGVTTYYLRSAGGNAVTVHPTLADAQAGTNTVSLGTTGGDFTVYGPKLVGDGLRYRFTMELIQPGAGGGNVLSPRCQQENHTLQATTVQVTPAANAGNISGLWPTFPDLTPVRLLLPPGSTGPIRVDTSVALAGNTTYYVTHSPNSSVYGRLHDTVEDAAACVDIATSLCASTDLIKYSAQGTGEMQFYFDDGTISWSFGYDRQTDGAPFVGRYRSEKVMLLVFSVDYNDPDATGVVVTLGVDETVTESIDDGETVKGLTEAAILQSPGTFLNSGASHVALSGRMYAYYAGATTSAPDFDALGSLVDYLINKYSILPFPPILLDIPTISGIERVNNTLTASPADYEGTEPISTTWQWYRDGVLIGSATDQTYILQAADEGHTLTVVQYATNAGGFVTEESDPTGVIAVAATPPTNTVSPTVPGSPDVGAVQNGDRGTWTGTAPISYTYQWQAADDASGTNLVDIPDITADTLNYIPQSSYEGKYLRLQVTATNDAPDPVIAYSAYSVNPVGPAIALEPETMALIARMNVEPSELGQLVLNACITNLKNAGIWAKLDALYGFTVESTQSIEECCLNWVASNFCTVSGTVTVQPGLGVTGDGTSGYLDTGINPFSAGGHYSRNSCSVFVRATTNVQSAGRAIALAVFGPRMTMQLRTINNSASMLMQATTSAYTESSTVTDCRGFHAMSRDNSSTIEVRFNDTARATGFSEASAALASSVVRFMNDSGTSYYSGQLAYGGFGGALTNTELDNLYAYMEDYITVMAQIG